MGFFSLFSTLNVLAQTVNICDRTAQVRNEILDNIANHRNCATVSTAQLSRIKSLDLYGRGIVELKEFDLEDLPALEMLDLGSNLLTTLPEDLFDGLFRLEVLRLSHNDLTLLPEDLFNGLSELELLDLGYNQFTSSLPSALFDGLKSLDTLVLQKASLSFLPFDLFDGLSRLRRLRLWGNSLTTLHEDLFEGLSNLTYLFLHENSLISLPSGLFDGLNNLQDLHLFDNSLTSLPKDLFDGLPKLEWIYIYDNSLTALDEELLNGLAKLERLYLANNSLTTLPEDIFDDVKSRLDVDLFYNPINCLPQKILDLRDAGIIIIYFNGELRACPEVLSQVILTLTPPAISELNGRSAVTARLSNPFTSSVTITVSASPNDPATPRDFEISPNKTLRIPAGDLTSSGIVTITAKDNNLPSGNKTITVSGQVANILGLLPPPDATLTILDDDHPVTLKIRSLGVHEEDGIIRVPVEVIPAPTTEVSVRYQTVGQTAEESKDYIPTEDLLRISPGSTMEFIEIEIIDDRITEPPEHFLVRLFEAMGADLDPEQATVTIEDNDEYRLQVDDTEAVEGSMELIFTVTLDAPNPEQVLRVDYATLDGTAMAPADYSSRSGTLEFQPGSTRQIITIPLVDDTEEEEAESLILELFNPDLAVLSNNSAIGTIIDDDEPPQISIVPSLRVQEDAGLVRFEVTLSHPATPPSTTVEFSVTDVSTEKFMDYSVQTQSPLRFTTGQSTQTIDVEIVDDELFEEEETFLIQLTNAEHGDIVQREGRGIIVDNDAITVSIYDERESEEAGSLFLPVRLSQPSSQLVTVQFTSSDVTAHAGSDYTASRGIVIFQRGSTEGKIHIQILNDEERESEETFQVTLSSPKNAILAQETGTGTIVDDDGSASISVQSVTVSRRVALFDLILSNPSPIPVLASYASEDGSALAGEDYEPVAGQVTFAPGEVSKTVEVKLLSNEPLWTAKTFSLVLLAAVNADVHQARTEAVIKEASEESIQNAYVSRVLRTWASQVVDALTRRMEGMAQCHVPEHLTWLRYRSERWYPGQIFSGCGAEFTHGGWSVWGQGAFTHMRGRDGALSLRSDVTTMLLGADYGWHQGWMAGLLAAQSWDQGTYETPTQSGTASSRLTGIYPYVSYQTETGMRGWILLGLGRGETEVETLDSEVDAALVALGLTGTLTGDRAGRLGYEVDAFWATATMENGSDLGVRRIRAGAEGSLRLGRGMEPYVEAALRQDGGDAETGMGLELGGGIRWSTSQLRAEFGGRTLLLHTSEGMREWGLMGAIEYGAVGGLGPSMRVRPLWGNVYGGHLWREAPLHSIALGNTDERIEMELGYGTPVRGSLGRSTVGITLDPRGRAYRVGYNLRMRQGLQFSVATTARTVEENRIPNSYGLSAQMDLRW